jgi:hypothetical protein
MGSGESAWKQTVCGCGYSLAGLTLDKGVVRCPECGRNTRVLDPPPLPLSWVDGLFLVPHLAVFVAVIGLSMFVMPERVGAWMPWMVAAAGVISVLGLGLVCAIREVRRTIHIGMAVFLLVMVGTACSVVLLV